jgi:hypothetical protein
MNNFGGHFSTRSSEIGEFAVPEPNSPAVVKIAKNRYNLNNLMREVLGDCPFQ